MSAERWKDDEALLESLRKGAPGAIDELLRCVPKGKTARDFRVARVEGNRAFLRVDGDPVAFADSNT